MKFFSWNVNGLRAILKKGDLDIFLKKYQPDILGLQEIKISEKKFLKEKIVFPDYKLFLNSAQREGYSGTAILAKNSFLKKNKIVKIENGIGIDKFDQEGRIQILELDGFYFLNIYFPNSNHALSRLKYKEEFNRDLLKYLKKIDKKKPVFISGDFNVAYQPIDLARPKENEGNPGYTKEERNGMHNFLSNNFIDTFRFLNKEKVQYSWWSFRTNARKRNIGWRIDYFLASARISKQIKKAYILDDVYGSDHCPVGLDLDL